MSITSMEIRHSFEKNDAKRDAGFSTPEGILRFDDILYGNEKNGRALTYIARRRLVKKEI